MNATINTLPNCPWCVRAKKLLDLKGIKYEEILSKSPDWKTVPYIVVNGQPIGGFTELAAWCRKL